MKAFKPYMMVILVVLVALALCSFIWCTNLVLPIF